MSHSEIEYLKSEVSRLSDIINQQSSWISILRKDVKWLLEAQTEEEITAAKNCLCSSLKTFSGTSHKEN